YAVSEGTMNFELDSEHEMIRQTVHVFAEKEVRPVAAHVDKTGVFPRATVAKMGVLGFLGVAIRTGNEGLGLDALALAIGIVEMGNPGCAMGKVEDKLGVRGSATSQVILSDCHVPKDAMLGAENDGFVNALKILDGGRIGIGSMAVGIAQGAFEESVKYARDRVQFSKPIAEHQAIQFMLADMATRI